MTKFEAARLNAYYSIPIGNIISVIIGIVQNLILTYVFFIDLMEKLQPIPNRLGRS